MSITTVPSVVTGQTYSAANYNTQVRDNINGIWVLTTAGDMLYATGATGAARLALVTGGLLKGGASAPEYLAAGVQHTYLRSTGSVPEYGPFVYRRQGGSSTVWSASGATTYTPTKSLMQVGTVDVSVSAGAGSQAVTYPTAFSQRPAIFLSVNASSVITYSWGLGWTDDTTSGFTAHIKFSGSFTGTAPISWLAIGE